MALKQRKVADNFTATFTGETVQRWRQMVKEWQANSSLPNPYVSNDRGMFFCCCFFRCNTLRFFFQASKLSEARLRLTQEEVAEAEHGQHAPHKISVSVFIRMGLELEDQQYVSAAIFFLLSNARVDILWCLQLLKEHGPMVRRQPSSRNGVFYYAKSRSGANYKRCTCPECPKPGPPTQDPRQGQKLNR